MTTDVRSFEDLGVDTVVVDALAAADIVSPFPIQELSLPMALAGADLIGQARTGTGKTLAFGIPLVQRVDPAMGHTQALVIVPTRELCLQVHDDLTIAGATRGVKVVAAYGGRAIDPQSEAIAAGAPIVVGTPGRLLDLCRRRLLDLSQVGALVLDEADEMLDMGFLPDVEQLIERCPADRQTLLFSATMPSEVVRLARRYMDKPTFMRTDVEQQQHIAPKTRQHFFACHRLDKPAVVARILAAPGRGRTLIFTRTKRMADVLASELRDRGIDAGVIHSDLRQEARERALARFRRGRIDVLCATEVAARGLDIEDVTHVINYDCPDDERMYLHRIGRTGRAGAAGVAVTLAVWNELARLDMIKRALDIDQPTHEVLSTSPMLDELFGPPARSADAGTGARDEAARQRRTRDDATSADDSAGDETRSRRGARRRRRRRSATAETTRSGGAGDGRTASEGLPTPTRGTASSAAAGAAPGSATAVDEGGADIASDQQPAVVPSDVDDASDHTSEGNGGAERPSRPSRGARRRRSGRGRRRSGRQDTRRPADADERADQRRAEAHSRAHAARGDGRPTLHRPLRITHLP